MQPVVTVHPMQVSAAPVPCRRSKYSCSVKSLGILQIIFAGISVTFGIATFAIYPYGTSVVGSGIWAGFLMYLPAGILGILSVTAAVSARRCLAIATLVMSILSALAAAGSIAVYSSAMALDVYYLYYNYDPGYYHNYNAGVTLALDSLLVLASLTEFIVAIVASVYCCYVMSEYKQDNTATIQYVSPQYVAPQMMVYNQPAVAPYTAGAPAPIVTSQVPAPLPDYGHAAAGAQDTGNDKAQLFA